MSLLSDFNSELAALLEGKAPLEARIVELTEQNGALTTQVSTLQAAYNEAVAASAQLELQVGDLLVRNSELSASVAEVTNQYNAARVALAESQAALGNASNEVAALTAARDALQQQLATVQSDLANMTAARNQAVAEIATLQSTLVTRTSERDAAVAAKAAAETALNAERTAHTATKNTLATRTAERDSARASLSVEQVAHNKTAADLLTAREEIVRLKAALAAAQSGGNKIQFGSSRPSAGLDPVWTTKRIYVEPGVAVPDLPPAPTATSGYLRTITTKGHRWPAGIDDMLVNRMRDGECVGPQHEAEDDIEKFMYGFTENGVTHAPGTAGLNPADWRAQCIAINDGIIRNNLVGKRIPYVIVMEFSINPNTAARRRNIVTQEMLTPEVVASLKAAGGGLGIDVYAPHVASANGPTRAFGTMYDSVQALCTQHGLTKWGVFETGASYNTDGSSNASVHLDWWTRNLDYLGTLPNPPKVFQVWNRPPLQSGTGITYAIDEVPGLVDVFKRAITKYGVQRSTFG